MRDITVVYSWYNPTEIQIQKHLSCYSEYTYDERKKIHFIFVDDCSETFPEIKPQFPINLTIAKILTDVGYNNGGAKNLGLYLSKTEWTIHADRDHLILPSVMTNLFKFEPTTNHVYFFKRKSENLQKQIIDKESHCNSCLIETKKFFELGGFDEDFSGAYGHEDRLLNEIMLKKGMIKILLNLELFEIRAFQTENLNRDMTRNDKILLQKRRDINYNPGKILRFKWEITKTLSIKE